MSYFALVNTYTSNIANNASQASTAIRILRTLQNLYDIFHDVISSVITTEVKSCFPQTSIKRYTGNNINDFGFISTIRRSSTSILIISILFISLFIKLMSIVISKSWTFYYFTFFRLNTLPLSPSIMSFSFLHFNMFIIFNIILIWWSHLSIYKCITPRRQNHLHCVFRR